MVRLKVRLSAQNKTNMLAFPAMALKYKSPHIAPGLSAAIFERKNNGRHCLSLLSVFRNIPRPTSKADLAPSITGDNSGESMERRGRPSCLRARI